MIHSEGQHLLGVDGCRAGWVVATINVGQSVVQFHIVTDLASRFSDLASVVAIDIPIGLPSGHPRRCDLEARQVLGPGQRSRVFPAPSRAAMAGVGYEHCCDLNEAVMGVRLSKQAHAIMPKIAEVDRLLTPALQARVHEVHPEVSFCVLNGGPLEHRKKTAEGQRERLAVLRRHGVVFDPEAERRRFGGSLVAIDDLTDAAVALVTASRIAAGTVRVLGDGRIDARGLRMEICA